MLRKKKKKEKKRNSVMHNVSKIDRFYMFATCWFETTMKDINRK